MSYSPPDPATYSIPSAGRRAAVAVLLLIPGLLLYVALPYYGLSALSGFGVNSHYSLGLIAGAGIVLAALGAARYFARPTAAYGPLSILGSLAAVAYLLLLARNSTFTVDAGNSATFSLGYGGLLLLFAIVPAIRMGSGILTTVEDLARPKERLPFDFPAPPSPPVSPPPVDPPSSTPATPPPGAVG